MKVTNMERVKVIKTKRVKPEETRRQSKKVRKSGKVYGTIVVMVLHFVAVQAQDTQWRGPQRDGKYTDTGLLKQWPKGGPDLLLMKDGLGNGYSTPVLYEGMIYISGSRDSTDVITKLDLKGNILWETEFGRIWEMTFPESRNTPTIEKGRIYIMSGMGSVVCLNTESGEKIWSVNTHEEFEGEFHRWGMAESLLLTENAVISSPIGGRTAVVALDKKDGSVLWQTKSEGGVRSYASPLMITYNNREMILVTSSEELIAVDPRNGEIIWAHDILTGNSGERNRRNNTNTPLYHDGEIFTTSGYDVNGIMLKLSPGGDNAELKWSDPALDTHHGGVVLVDGYIYGSNWISNGMGNWICQEWATGKVMYDQEWHNKGSIIYADGLLYVYEEKQGHVGLVEPTPEGFNVISSFRIQEGTGPFWAHMSIYDKKLLIRHGTVLFVYDLEKKD